MLFRGSFATVAAVLLVLLCAALPSFLVRAGGEADGATQLTAANFESVVGGAKPVLVAFTAPWCGHCKSLVPEYSLAAQAFAALPAADAASVVVAQVDCDANPSVASSQGVQGFPTIKYYPAGSTTGEDYNGGRSGKDIVTFLNGKTGLNAVVKLPPSYVVALTESDFDSVAMDAGKTVIVKFFAEWCGHCKRLAPDYEKVALAFDGEDSVVVAEVDAQAYPGLASRFGVKGYPTIKVFRAGTEHKSAEDYNGGRDPAAFISYLNEAAGTHRVLGGGVSEKAGRDEACDAAAAELVAAVAAGADTAAAVAAVNKAAAAAAAEGNALAGKFYPLGAKNTVAKGAKWAAGEVARLTRMAAQGGKLTGKAKAELLARANIAKQFAPAEAAEEGKDEL